MRLMGLDIGTTGCKVTLFEEDGRQLCAARREYGIMMPHPGWVEQDAELVWRLAKDAIREVVATFTEDGECGEDIGAIGLSVQGEAVMPVDKTGVALAPAILGMDTRTTKHNDILVRQFGARSLFDRSGMPVHTINTLPKLMWLKTHRPELWRSADRFLLYEDFIINKMTDKAVISQCLASRTQVYDVDDQSWSEDMLDYLGLDVDRLADIHPSGTVVATMKADVSAELGFAKPPLVVTGGHDQACGALGVGLVEPGLAMVSTGTAEVVEVAMASPVLTDALYEGNISVYSHTVAGLYVAMTLNHSGGLLLRWYRDTFGEMEKQAEAQTGIDAYDALLANAPDGPTGVLVLPHFFGSGTPTMDTASKGAILGLTFGTTKASLAKAILEGLTYELRMNLDILRDGGVEIAELRAIGGGARSSLWLQMKADITGIPVIVPKVTDAAAWGAALLAGYGAGCWRDLHTVAGQLVQVIKRYTPDPQRRRAYNILYQQYCEVYPTVKPIHDKL